MGRGGWEEKAGAGEEGGDRDRVSSGVMLYLTLQCTHDPLAPPL